jgi:hypothetical protein
MNWERWHPLILQTKDGSFRIYKGKTPAWNQYELKRHVGGNVYDHVAWASNADELKAMVEEQVA